MLQLAHGLGGPDRPNPRNIRPVATPGHRRWAAAAANACRAHVPGTGGRNPPDARPRSLRPSAAVAAQPVAVETCRAILRRPGPVPPMAHPSFSPPPSQVDPPDHTKIPRRDVLGVTVILLTCAYKGREFVRVGYYVNNDVEGGLPAPAQNSEEDGDAVMEEEEEEDEEEEDEEDGEEEDEEDGEEEDDSAPDNQNSFVSKQRTSFQGPVLPEGFDMSKVRRSILDASPRITRFAIDWD